MPSQKLGMLAPSIATPVKNWSTMRPRNTADTMPQGSPINAAIATAISASSVVGSARSISACVTGRCRKIDWPRLPCSTSRSQ
jgi:hypothetical protein